MKKGITCFIFYFIISEALFSLPPQKIIHPGDWAYDALAILSREQSKVFFTDSRITVAEMENYLEEIDLESLSESAYLIFERLVEYLKSGTPLSFSSDAVSGGLDLIVQPEGYFKTNEKNPWIYNDHERNHLLQIPLGFSFESWITAEMDLYFGQNEYASSLHDNYINVPLDIVPQTDIHFPKRAYMSAGLPVREASGLNFSIGIGDNFFGRTQTGSIILSEHLERTVYAQGTIYSPAFKYTTQVIQYEVNKYQYMHYLHVRPHKKFSISITEGVMVNAPLELRFLNPFTIFHSHEAYKTYREYNKDLGHQPHSNHFSELWDKDENGNDLHDRSFDPNNHTRIGSILGVKAEYQPWQYFRFYGLFVMNQFNLPMKKDTWYDLLYPDAMGFQAGIEYSYPVQSGYWEFGLEGVYTMPYLYVSWDKGWSFYKEAPEMLRKYNLKYWTGTPFGPDTIAGTFWAGFRSSELWYAGFTFEFSARGERSEFSIFDRDNSYEDTYRPSNWVYDVTVPPTGIPVFTYTASFHFEYQLRQYLTIAFMPGYRIAGNAGHEEGRIEQGIEFALSLQYKPLNHYLAKY